MSSRYHGHTVHQISKMGNFLKWIFVDALTRTGTLLQTRLIAKCTYPGSLHCAVKGEATTCNTANTYISQSMSWLIHFQSGSQLTAWERNKRRPKCLGHAPHIGDLQKLLTPGFILAKHQLL